MRKRDRQLAADRHAELTAQQADLAETARTRHVALMARQEDLARAIAAVQPAQVDMTQELADDLVRKIHGPLTISQECSDWLRTLVPGADWWHTSPVGYSNTGGQLRVQIKTNGTLFIELCDVNGATMWRATLVPPDFGKEPAHG